MGNTLETYFGVSNQAGATTQEVQQLLHRVIANRSDLLCDNQKLDAPAGGYNTGLSAVGTTLADGVNAEYIEAKSYVLADGVDNYDVSLGELQEAYNLLTVESVSELDYILQGPGMANLDDSVSKANFLISIAEERRDCMVFLSPYRTAVLNQPSSTLLPRTSLLTN